MDELITNLELPGFRFHPTEEELLDFYLKNMVFGKKMHYDIIGFLNIYRHDPWDLPDLAKIGEREWYFFVPRDRKHGSGGRPNRITEHGFWKATGTDRKIFSLSDPKKMIGLKKTLVFYEGRAPRGRKSDWVMNEYRLPDNSSLPKDIVLCKIYRKATSLKVLEQRAAADEMMKTTTHAHDHACNSASQLNNPPSSMDTISFNTSQEDVLDHHHHHLHFPSSGIHLGCKKEDEEEVLVLEEKHKDESETSQGSSSSSSSSSALQLPNGFGILEDLQLPKFTMDWTQDPFWTQLRSPWLDSLTTPSYAMF